MARCWISTSSGWWQKDGRETQAMGGEKDEREGWTVVDIHWKLKKKKKKIRSLETKKA
jgi:hypothetical protein